MRPSPALVLLLIGGVLACRDRATEPARLLDRMEGARIAITEKGPRAVRGRLLETQTGPSVHLSLPSTAGWRALDEAQRPAWRVPPGWAVWQVDVDVPTGRAGSVTLESEGRPLPRWDRRGSPEALAWFYQPGGFLRRGFYLAAPPGSDPRVLDLSYRYDPGPEELAERITAAGRIPPAHLLSTRATRADTTRPALLLLPGLAVEIPVPLQGGDVLEAGLGRPERAWEDGGVPSRLRIDLRREGVLERIAELPFASPASEEAWQDVRLPIPQGRGHASALRFELLAAPERVIPRHHLSDPRVIPRGERVDPRPHLAVFMIDGLRRDRMSRELTPTLWRLAEGGVRFGAAYASAPWTRASLASIFTGVPPAEHGIESEDLAHVLPTSLPTLAERLRARGYRTAAFSANLHMHPYFGLDRGFGNARTRLEDGARVVAAVERWLAREPATPLFLFVFTMDTHAPYRHRPEFDRSSHLDSALRSPAALLSARDRRRRGVPKPSPEEIEKLEALYDENVRYSDARLAELLEALEVRGLLERTVVVVTSDHGEAFGEHGDFFHGTNLHEELVAVPLVAAGPGLARGVRVEDPVSLAWLPEALLALAGLGPPPRLDLRAPTRPQGEAIVFETGFRGADLAGILRSPLKLILDRRQGRLSLYDLERDPEERRDLASQQADAAGRLAAELQAILARAEARRGDPAPGAGDVDPATAAQLRALGYAD